MMQIDVVIRTLPAPLAWIIWSAPIHYEKPAPANKAEYFFQVSKNDAVD